MKRYTLRGLIHDAKIFNQLRLEYRRTKKDRRKNAFSDGLSRYMAGMRRACELKRIKKQTVRCRALSKTRIGGQPATKAQYRTCPRGFCTKMKRAVSDFSLACIYVVRRILRFVMRRVRKCGPQKQ